MAMVVIAGLKIPTTTKMFKYEPTGSVIQTSNVERIDLSLT